MDKLQRAMALLDRFEPDAFEAPVDAEMLLVEIFEACRDNGGVRFSRTRLS